MKQDIFAFRQWLPDARKYLSADLLAGLTLWAMVVPETVAHGMIAGAPNLAAGLYMVVVAFPIYALFASSRLMVASSTAAVSATTAGFLAILSGQPEANLAALVVCTAIAFLIFYYLRLGFLADFISLPVSRGFLVGLGLFIIVGQLPKVFGIEKADGNVLEKLWALVRHIGDTNLVTLAIAAVMFAILAGSHLISRKIPAGLVAMLLSILLAYNFGLESRFGVAMVGALPAGLPVPVIPTIHLADLAILIPASIGLVVLATSESAVVAEAMAVKHGHSVDVNKQFLAFGAANIGSGLFGGLLSAGSTSSTLVNESAGARTLVSTLWVSLLTILTLLFLTDLFNFVPEAFLAALVIHAVWHLIGLGEVLSVRKFSKGEFYLSALALLGVLLFDVLYGLLLAMLLNVLYAAYRISKVRVGQYGLFGKDQPLLVPMSMEGTRPLPPNTLAFGLSDGMLFYASARSSLQQAQALIKAHPEAHNIVMSVEKMTGMDFTSHELMKRFEAFVRASGRKLFITNVHDPVMLKQLQDARFDPDVVDVSIRLDMEKLV